MSKVETTAMPLAKASRIEFLVHLFVSDLATSGISDDTGVVLDTIAGQLSVFAEGVDGKTTLLLVRVPARMAPDLSALAASKPEWCNEVSADLRSSRPYVTFRGSRYSVSLDLWRLSVFPGDPHHEGFLVGFISADTFVLARHIMTADEMDSLLAGAQVQVVSSGINFNPWRIFSAEEMDAAEGRADPVDENRVIVTEYWGLTSDEPLEE